MMPHTRTLFSEKPLSSAQSKNSALNLSEMDRKEITLQSFPRRIVLELTSACNMRCAMCGRTAVEFKPSYLPLETVNYLGPLLNTVEEVTLMGWGEPTIHPDFISILETLDAYDARKYFLTNGKTLDGLKEAIFRFHVDIVRVSVNGAVPATNDSMRKGSSLKAITKTLREIVGMKKERGIALPYLGFVMCLQRSNLDEFPALVDLAADIGLNNCKGVFLTAFSDDLAEDVLWGYEDRVRRIFDISVNKALKAGINLDLPYIPGSDPAGTKKHQDCTVCWRDFFIGADAYVRPCMSYNEHLFKLDPSKKFSDHWNSPEYRNLRACVNDDGKMPRACARCFQSSFTNWNLKNSFLPDQSEKIAPEWEG
jgi:MoaA/NifB/PqqE/SkfB family radical SAM enzyme